MQYQALLVIYQVTTNSILILFADFKHGGDIEIFPVKRPGSGPLGVNFSTAVTLDYENQVNNF